MQFVDEDLFAVSSWSFDQCLAVAAGKSLVNMLLLRCVFFVWKALANGSQQKQLKIATLVILGVFPDGIKGTVDGGL